MHDDNQFVVAAEPKELAVALEGPMDGERC